MLNKKTLFNFVYALALVGAITTCVGFLNEVLNLTNFFNMNVTNLNNFWGKNYWEQLILFLVAFLLSALATAAVIFDLIRVLTRETTHSRLVMLGIPIVCVILLVISMVFVFFLRYLSYYGKEFLVSNYNYLQIYALRSGVMSFLASMGIIWTCNFIENKSAAKTNAKNGDPDGKTETDSDD